MEKAEIMFHPAGSDKEGFVNFGDKPPGTTEEGLLLFNQFGYEAFEDTVGMDLNLLHRVPVVQTYESVIMVWQDSEGVHAYRYHPLSITQDMEGKLASIYDQADFTDRCYMVKETEAVPVEP